MGELLQRLQSIEITSAQLNQLAKILFHTVSLLVGGLIVLRFADIALRRVRSILPPGDVAGARRVEQRAETLRQIVRSVGRTVLGVVVILVLAKDIGIDTAPLLASAGIVGLAVGFGAQSLVKDVLAGFFVILEDQYGVGDSIRIGDQDGVVEQMTLRVTVLRNFEGQVHVIPNGTIQTVTVLTKDWSRAVVDFTVGHGEDLGRVFEVLKRVNQEISSHFADRILEPPQINGIEKLSEDGVTIRLTAKTLAGKQGDVLHEWRRMVKESLQAEGIEMARRNAWIVSDRGEK